MMCECEQRVESLERRLQGLIWGLGRALMPHEFHAVTIAINEASESPTAAPHSTESERS